MASVGGAGESVAVVVGASELGSATATLLAGAGFTMVAADAVPKALDELPEGIRREMGDTTDQAVAKTLIDRIAGEAGPPEVLVNTIGGFLLDEAGNATPEDLRVMMDASLGAALWLSQVVEPYLRQRGSGAIVHLPARPGTDPAAGAAYGRSKAALSHRVRILDLDLRRHGVGVNAVAPHLLDTSRNRAGLPGGGAGTRRPAGSGRGHHRLPPQRPRRTRQRDGRAGLRRLGRPHHTLHLPCI
jgi:NAD(P)-dependent dehydrogenase (short-subunit alcohol dehydrogenase family)